MLNMIGHKSGLIHTELYLHLLSLSLSCQTSPLVISCVLAAPCICTRRQLQQSVMIRRQRPRPGKSYFCTSRRVLCILCLGCSRLVEVDSLQFWLLEQRFNYFLRDTISVFVFLYISGVVVLSFYVWDLLWSNTSSTPDKFCVMLSRYFPNLCRPISWHRSWSWPS